MSGEWRWVITHIGVHGLLRMTDPAQGRYTYATEDEAERRMRAILSNVTNDAAGVFGEQSVGTFEVRRVECWPGHHDPKSFYVEE